MLEISIFLNRSLLLKRKNSDTLNQYAPVCPFLNLEKEDKPGHRQTISWMYWRIGLGNSTGGEKKGLGRSWQAGGGWRRDSKSEQWKKGGKWYGEAKKTFSMLCLRQRPP